MAALAAALLMGATAATGAASPAPLAAAPPGCATATPTVVHHAGGVPVDPAPDNRPEACAGITGFGGSETRISVTNTGAVIYEPAVTTPGPAGLGFLPEVPGLRFQTSASPAGLAVTHDDGATWSFVRPAGLTWESQDHQGYVDRATGRFFFYALNANPIPQPGISPAEQPPGAEAHLLWTGDDGRTWVHTTACCPGLSENPRFAAAVAPAGGEAPRGYPDVVYFCANNSILLVSPAGARVCSASLDGGTTWTQRAILISKPVPQHPECGASGEDFGPTDGNYPQPRPDGSLVVMVACGGKTFLARSSDEAATWPILRDEHGGPLQIPNQDELRTDSRGTLYGFRSDGARILLRMSQDGGLTWSPELNVTAPGVTGVGVWSAAVREPGHVAVAYLGQTAGQATWDGYLTDTTSALEGLTTSGATVLASARLNDPTRPLMFGTSLQGTPSVLVDYVGADIGPDGTPWASFVQDCGTSPSDQGCTAQDGQNRGFAGRFVAAALAGSGPGPLGPPPSGRLPTTGGPPPLLPLGAVVLGAGASARFLRRRSQT
ncbi:MAG: hypothetical protein QOG64_429 [Acidimicrobiaceae bacterium]|nr:hypothetical protein [Acidimicrobiaceae bacterium]